MVGVILLLNLNISMASDWITSWTVKKLSFLKKSLQVNVNDK